MNVRVDIKGFVTVFYKGRGKEVKSFLYLSLEMGRKVFGFEGDMWMLE